MDLSSLEIFRMVAAEQSVTRAAERLHRVQSNVTTRIRQLEEDLGGRLFRREGKRMTLTAEGEVLLAYAHRLLSLADEARQAVRPGQPVGRFRIGTMESTAASRLPVPLAAFHQRWPDVALDLSADSTGRLVERLLAHELDCAFVAPPGTAYLPDRGLEGVPVFTEELLLILPAWHGPVASLADLKVGTLAALQPGCTYRRLAEDWLGSGRWPLDQPLRLLELGSYHAILACVAAGGSLGVIPRSVLELQRQPVALRLHSLGTVDTLLVWRKGYRSASLDAFRAVLSGA